MITPQLDRAELISIIPPRDARADLITGIDHLRARFARNEGHPFADVLTEASIRDALDEHEGKYGDRVFGPSTTIWGFLCQVRSDDHSCRDAVRGSSPTGRPTARRPARPTRPATATPGAASRSAS